MHNQDIDTEVENSCWNVYKNKPTTSDHSCWSDADKFCITWSSKSKSLSPRHGDSFGTYYPARVYSKVTSPPSTNFDVVFRKCHFEDYLSLTLCVKRLNLKLSWPTFFAVAFLERKGQLICSLKCPSDRDALKVISFNTVHRLRLLHLRRLNVDTGQDHWYIKTSSLLRHHKCLKTSQPRVHKKVRIHTVAGHRDINRSMGWAQF